MSSTNSDSTYNRFDHEFSQIGISQDMYSFKEEEETPEKLKNNKFQEQDDYFRHKAIQIDDIHKFRHKIDIQNILINRKDGFTYFKSDYFYASKIDETNVEFNEIKDKLTEKKDSENHEIDFTGKTILKLIHKPYFRLFGFELLTPINDDNSNDNEIKKKFKSFLYSISLNRNAQLNNIEAKEEWEKFNKDIEYNEISLDDCKAGGDYDSILKWVLAFHNFGIMNQIYFTFTIFYEEEEKIKFSKFSVGKKYHRNRCFVTFLSNGKEGEKKQFIPHVLSLITITKKEKIKEKDAQKFSPISNIFWLLTSMQTTKTNIQYDFMTCKTLYYNIYVQENQELPINYKKSKNSYDENKPNIALISVSKLNCFLRKVKQFKMATLSNLLINYYSNVKKKITNSSDKKILNFHIDSYQSGIAHVRNVDKESYYTENINEYKIFVGLRGISYENLGEYPQVSSHVSIITYMKLISIYVDENLNKMYCLFSDFDDTSRLVEGDFGTTNADDMKTILLFGFTINKAEFKVDIYNHLYLLFENNDFLITCIQNTDGSWGVIKKNMSQIEPKPFLEIDNIEDNIKIGKFQRYTLPIALEISNKLFVMCDTSTLYHPSWRNCILRQAIISTFYRFAYHMVTDSLVFEVSDTNTKNKESEVVSAIIYPQIDIGFRGNIRRIFTSTISPGIYEYSDRAFNYEPLKDLLPNTKTDCLFFNNGKLKVGLDRHRTKCQIAATALFGYACSIYGPGMMIRDFKIGEGNPYSRKSFQLIHNFLVAAYGTFLKMENEKELEYAIDVISEELHIEDNKHVYKNLMDELRKDYY